MSSITGRFVSCVPALIVVFAASLGAQPTATYKSGAEYYLAYRAVFMKATTIDEIVPWMSKQRRDQIAKETPADRKEMFDMIKTFDDRTNVKVVRETPTATGAELQVEGVSAESKAKGTGVITLVKEGPAWRIDRESWKGGM